MAGEEREIGPFTPIQYWIFIGPRRHKWYATRASPVQESERFRTVGTRQAVATTTVMRCLSVFTNSFTSRADRKRPERTA